MLPAVQKAYDICRWLLPVTARFPRKLKYTLGERVQTLVIELACTLVEAAHARRKDRHLYRANRQLDQLRLLLRLAHDVDLLSLRQLEFASGMVEELGRMTGGWLRASGETETSIPSVREEKEM